METFSKDLAKGQRAKELLENPLLAEAFDTIEQELTEIWKTSKINQPELREDAFQSLRALQRFQSILQTWLNTGKIAQAELARAEAKAEREKELF